MRSNTDIAIVFMTPIAPIPTASSEIARLSASMIRTPWSSSPISSIPATVVRPGFAARIDAATASGSTPGRTLT